MTATPDNKGFLKLIKRLLLFVLIQSVMNRDKRDKHK
jgi:hypothetical protein